MEVAEDDDVEYFREEVGVLPDKGITAVFKMEVLGLFHYRIAEPHSSVGSVADFRTGGHWFKSPARPILVQIPVSANILSEDG